MFNQQPQMQPQYVMMPPQQQPMFLLPPAQQQPQLSATDVLLLMNAMAAHSPSVSQQVVIPGQGASYVPGPQIQATPPAIVTAHAGETDAKLAALKTKHAEGALATGDLRIDVEQLVSESVDSGWRALESIAAEMEQKDAVTAGVVKHCLDSAKEKLNHVLTATHKGVAQTQDGHNLIHLGSSATRSVLMIVSKGFAELFEHQRRSRPEQPTAQVKQQPEDSRVQKSPLAVGAVEEDTGVKKSPPRSSQAAAAVDEDAGVQKQRSITPPVEYQGDNVRRPEAQMPVIHVNVHSPHPAPPQQIHHHHGVASVPVPRHEVHHHYHAPAPEAPQEVHHHHHAPPPPAAREVVHHHHHAPLPPAPRQDIHHHHHHVVSQPVLPQEVHHHHNAPMVSPSAPAAIVESDEAEKRANEEDVDSGSGIPDLPPNPRQAVRRDADTNIAGNVASALRGVSKTPRDDVRQAAVVMSDEAREDEEEEGEELQADRDDALAVAKAKGKAAGPLAPLVSADDSQGDEDYVETGESSNKAPVVMGNRIPPAEESVDDSAQDDEDDEEGEDYDDDDSGTEADRAEAVVSPVVDATNDTNRMDSDDLAFEEEVQDSASANVPAVEKSPPRIRVVLNRRMTLPSGKTPY